MVGATLITQGILVAILRFLSLVYAVASEAYNADRFRTPLPNFIPWVLITIVISFALVWAGSFLRRAPDGAWADVGLRGRVALAAAGLINAGALAWSVVGLARSPSTVEATLTWIAVGLSSVLVVGGLIRDARRRPDR